MWPTEYERTRRAGPTVASDPQGVMPDERSVDLIGNPAVARGPWGLWLQLVMPAVPASYRQDANQREHLRRARLMSVFLFVGFLVTLGLAPEIFVPSFDVTELAVIGTAFAVLIIATLLNRSGHVASAATLLIAGVMVTIAANQLTYTGGLPLSGRTAFDFFVIPIVLAGILLPRNVAFVCWGGASAFIFLDLLLGPKQHDLVAFIAQQGIYTVAATPVVLLERLPPLPGWPRGACAKPCRRLTVPVSWNWQRRILPSRSVSWRRPLPRSSRCMPRRPTATSMSAPRSRHRPLRLWQPA